MVLLFFDFLLRGVAAGQKWMTLVGEIDFQLLELNLADSNWMCYPDKQFRILQRRSFESDSVRHSEYPSPFSSLSSSSFSSSSSSSFFLSSSSSSSSGSSRRKTL